MCPARLLFVLCERAQWLLVPLPAALTISHSDPRSIITARMCGSPSQSSRDLLLPAGTSSGQLGRVRQVHLCSCSRLSFFPQCQCARPGRGDAIHGNVPRPGAWVRLCMSVDTFGMGRTMADPYTELQAYIPESQFPVGLGAHPNGQRCFTTCPPVRLPGVFRAAPGI